MLTILCFTTNNLLAQYRDIQSDKVRVAFNKEISKDRKKAVIKHYRPWEKPPMRIDTVSPLSLHKPHTVNIYSPLNRRKMLIENISSESPMYYIFVSNIIYIGYYIDGENKLIRIDTKNDNIKNIGAKDRSIEIIGIDTLGVYLRSINIRNRTSDYEYFLMLHNDTTIQKIPFSKEEAIIHFNQNYLVVQPKHYDCSFYGEQCDVIIRKHRDLKDTLNIKLDDFLIYMIENMDNKYILFGKSNSFFIFNNDIPQKSKEVPKQTIENALKKYIKYQKHSFTYQRCVLINGNIYFWITLYSSETDKYWTFFNRDEKEFVLRYSIEKEDIDILYKLKRKFNEVFINK